MGRVYLAEDPNIGRKIALKVLSPRGICEPDDAAAVHQRFLLEARAAGRLSHPGIVTVYDADSDPASGAPYLAMEWVRGRSLYAILKSDDTLPVASATSLAAQVARALDYAHRHDVIHRDVKPSNLLVSDNGAVKVVDFGIAKLVSASLTLPGAVLGTPFYMAPEQVKAEPVDGRTDLFALGAVLYECVTGRQAFGGESLSNVNYKILSVQPRPAEMYRPEVPPSLRRVLDRLLAKRPDDRYRTGGELADALDAVTEEASAEQDGHRPSPPGTAVTRSDVEAIVAPPPETVAPPKAVALPPEAVAPPPEAVAPSPEAVPAKVEQREVPRAAGSWLFDAALVITLAVLVLVLVADTPKFWRDLRQAGAGAGETFSGWLRPIPLVGPWLEEQTARTATLEIIFKHSMDLGFISVWVDSRKVMTEKLVAAGADRPAPELRQMIAVRRGGRSVEVHVSGLSMKVEARKMIRAIFAEGEMKQLWVELTPGNEELNLILKE